MKKTIGFMTLCAALAIAIPVTAKNRLSEPTLDSQDQCTSENKDAWYASFREVRTSDQPKAYDLAKKYLGCAASATEAPTDAQKQILDYLKRWTTAYEEGTKKNKLPTLIYTEKKYPEAYALGRELLAADPENLKVLIDLGANGYLVAGQKNPALNADALNYAKKAIQLLESGKTVEDWQPLSGKDEALAYLHYTVGYLTLENDPSGALTHLIKAAQAETPLKKSPLTYAYIAGAYESGPYTKQSDAYKATYQGKDETPESKLALANINQIIDRMVDAYARAVALAGTDARLATQKTSWTESLTNWYKFRHNNTDTGMNEFVAGILSKPLPPEPTPLTSLPASTPAATPAGTNGTVSAAESASTSTSTSTSAAGSQPGKTTNAAGTQSKPAGAKTGTHPGSNRPQKNR